MKLSDFNYHLPKELIAQYPLEERDTARLLVVDRAKASIEHRIFRDLKNYLKPQDLLVLNDTKVLPARLIGRRPTGGRVEVLLLEPKAGLVFSALIKPGRVKLGERIIFNGKKITGELTGRQEITFCAGDREEIYGLGKMPLPPYIKRESQDSDNVYYQTVYAARDGSVAAPTAGLHFTYKLLDEIKSFGVNIAYVTLHVGHATFKPVKAEDITQHKMDKEYFQVPDSMPALIKETRVRNNKVIAVGTTSCRTLEAYAAGVKEGFTDLFIYPGYKFKLVDYLLTNFHLPRTTLFMLVCAFAGEKLIKKAYQEAVDKKYRFYSYGDAMLIV
jgi:S-adenosylmethionine:tRNA ribosyltransferase-isomerase